MPAETMMTDTATTTEGEASTPATDPATVADDSGQAQQSDGQDNPTEGQQAAGDPAEGDGTEGKQDDGKKEDKPAGAPEKYEFTTPEGHELDSEVLGQFSEAAKELDLSQDKAQLLLDKMAPAIAARQTQQIKAVQEQWANDARSDKEFGGDKLNENLSIAKKGLETYGTPELRTLLNDSGMGNHPEVIRFFVRVGKTISEDSVVPGSKAMNRAAGDPKRLYPNSNMN